VILHDGDNFQLTIYYVHSKGVFIDELECYGELLFKKIHTRKIKKESRVFLCPMKNGQNISLKVILLPIIQNC